MKKFNTLFFLMLLFVCGSLNAQDRYMDEVFTEVTVTTEVEYATNISVITGAPAPETLVMDIYEPTGDTETNRPVVIVWHTGNFLPRGLNGSPVGDRDDFTPTTIANKLARRGYVAIIPSYRKGWNPVGDLDDRVGTLINASYRAIQDSRALVRMLNKGIQDEGNPYGICSSRIVQWGIGTGGYITLGTATLDEYNDVVLEKFIGPDIFDASTGMPGQDGIPDPYVIEGINGDPDGLLETPLNMVNNPGYSSDFALSVNMGGALGDLSWIDENDPPMISFHTPLDPFAPYNTDILIVPTTGDLIVEVSGSYDALERANELGINDVLGENSGDAFSDAAAFTGDNPNNPDATVGNLKGLMPFNRPGWTNPFSGLPAHESDPWNTWSVEFWSTQAHPSCPDGAPLDQCNFNVINSINNADHSVEKAVMYIDSTLGYFLPRAFNVMDLGAEVCTTSTEEVVANNAIGFTAIPNPATSEVRVSVNADVIMEAVTLFNISGQAVATYNNVNASSLLINRNGLPNGVYLAKVTVEGGVATQKVIFN
jgi:hypothetical protein